MQQHRALVAVGTNVGDLNFLGLAVPVGDVGQLADNIAVADFLAAVFAALDGSQVFVVVHHYQHFRAVFQRSGGQGEGDAAGAGTVESREADDLLYDYLSEIREYVLTPNEKTRQEMVEIERSLEQDFLARGDRHASDPGDQAEDAARRALIGQVIDAGREAVALTDNLATELGVLEEIEDDLLGVLEEAGAVVAGQTNQAFETGFIVVAVVILAVLMAIFLVGYLVSRGISGPLRSLGIAASRFGEGDLSVRAEVTSRDEIGGLAAAFNRMAGSLEASIEERGKAEAANLRLARIVEDTNNEIFVFDADTLDFLEVNRAACSNLGYTLTELEALTPVDIKPEYSREEFERLIAPLKNGEETYLRFETVHRRKDASLYDVAVTLQVLRSDDRPVFAAIIEDITDRKLAEEQLRQAQKMEAVGQLTGGIAHDFNNMLGAIIGNIEIMGDHLKGNAAAERSLQTALRASTRAAELTSRLLSFSRRQHLEPETIDLGEVIDGMRGLLLTTLGETIELKIRISENLRTAWVDPGQLENAIVNLAINARDAMPTGGQLSIEVTNADIDEDYAARAAGFVPGAYVVLTICDTGIGIPEALKERVFEPFFTTKGV